MTPSRSALPARRRRRLAGRLAAALAPPALLGAVLVVPASAAGTATPHAATATAATTTTASTTAAASTAATTKAVPKPVVPVPVNGLRDAAYTVTLPTGDQVRLTRAAAGRYTVAGTPGPAGGPAIDVTTTDDPAKGLTGVYALPPAAGRLVAEGLADRNLFDVGWLAAHGDSGAHPEIPVVVRYTGHPDAAALALDAAGLPGATVVGTAPATGAVTMHVAAADAGAFWTALTGGTAQRLAETAAPRLAAGVAHVAAAGHPDAAAARPAADTPLFTLVATVSRTDGVPTYCSGMLSQLCFGDAPTVMALTGAGAGATYRATGMVCADDPCTDYQITYAVPTGTYLLDGSAEYFQDDRMKTVDVIDPQFSVVRNTDLAFDLNKALPISVATPRPSEAYSGSYQACRVLPDGEQECSIVFAGYGVTNFLVTPTQRVTVGSFETTSTWTLGKPTITMAVKQPEPLTLHPVYPSYGDTDDPARPWTRFSGDRTMPVVYAKTGTKADFQGLDAHGRLVLLRLEPGDIYVEKSQLDNAAAAGAAGVLVDPMASADPAAAIPLPITPGWWGAATAAGRRPATLPWAALPPAEADTLTTLLGRGTVRVAVSDGGTTPYLYNIKPHAEGQVAGSLRTKVTSDQLYGVDTRLHASAPGRAVVFGSAYRSDENLVTGTAVDLDTPAEVTEYYGPVAPDTVWQREADTLTGTTEGYVAWDVFDVRGGSRAEDWLATPEVPGAATPPADAIAAQPGRWTGAQAPLLCAFCRQGDTFFPYFEQVSGAVPRVDDGPYMVDPAEVHLYRGAQEIPQSLIGAYPAFTLPAAKSTYRLTTVVGDADTDWGFSSAAPAGDATPTGTQCAGTEFGVSTAPCAAAPLILLRYDAGTGLTDAVTAPGSHRLGVTAYYAAGTAPAKVTGLKVWTSTDGGATWHAASVTATGGGSFAATYTVPAVARTDSAVSIRTQAADSAGDTVDQTVYDAYDLAAPTG